MSTSSPVATRTIQLGDAPVSSDVAPPRDPILIFQTGFEGTSTVVPFGESDHTIIGKDDTLADHNDWTEDLLKRAGVDNFSLQYTGGDISQRFAKIVPEPGNPSNHVLWFRINEPWPASENQIKARVQANIYGLKGGLENFYQSVRVFVHEDFNALRTFPGPIHWLTLAEFWNNIWWPKDEKYGFRVTFGMGKPSADASDLVFHANAENPGQIEVWGSGMTDVKVPIGKWFTLDYYYKCGDQNTGRFWVSVTPDGEPTRVVMDIRNYTHNTFDPAPTPIDSWNPMKMYTSKEVIYHAKSQGKTLQIYWDDFKLWTNKHP